ncbi:DEAD/DEAH box helicase [Candidatus Babeliales bacterium]|nr:DEAD/DEAH box helicase [Candidatus Babeliales bacterium]
MNNTFDNLLLIPQIQDSLKNLGFTQPTAVQSEIIPLLLENFKQDVHVQAQTGTGKTLAFGIPLLQAIDPTVKAVQGLVMAPTRELVLQIYESLRDVSKGSGIVIEHICGGMPINAQISALRRGVHIIIGTPGRINDHLERKTLKLDTLKVLVLDEADIMLDMGFMLEIDAILKFVPEERNIWLFSATVMSGIQKLIRSHMKNVVSIKSSQGAPSNASIKQYYCMVPQRKRLEATIRFIEAAPSFYGIIFCRTKTLTTEVTEELASKGFKVNCLHGDMKQTLRNHVIKGFKKRDFSILVATDVAGRGIDVSDLTHVINYSIPDESESYVHRIGRTGRAGKEGIAIMFIAGSEKYRLKRIEAVVKSTLSEITVPPMDAIITAKMSGIADFIELAKQTEIKDTGVDKALTELISSFTDQEIRYSFAVALKEKFLKGVRDGAHDSEFTDSSSSSHSYSRSQSSNTVIPQEICIELGQDDGLDEQLVSDYILAVCGIEPQEVTKLRVLRNKTFIAVPDNKLKTSISQMQSTPILDRAHRVHVVQDVYREQQSSGRPRRLSPRRDGGRSNDSRDSRGGDRRDSRSGDSRGRDNRSRDNASNSNNRDNRSRRSA